jgi:zinc protease
MKFVTTSLVVLSSLLATAQPKTTPKAPQKPTPVKVADIDRSKAPVAGPAPKIQVGQYQSFDLPNGMKVFVVENHKIPTVSALLSIVSNPYHEGDKAGMVDLTGQMLTRGTATKSKDQIDAQVDFIGASLSSSGGSVSADFLSKYTDQMMELFAEVVQNPSFNDEEFQKLKRQTISSLKSNKSDANAIARNVARVLRNGKQHPYGNISTEESVARIELNDLRNYYKQFFVPNNAYMVLVGDIDVNRARMIAEKAFNAWQSANSQMEMVANPQPPKQTQVVLVNKPGAVQSVIQITYPIQFNQKSKDFFAAMVMNEMLGGGIFGSRLNQNLREGKAYTYGAGSRLSTDPFVSGFTASASVRTEVTDSAVDQFMLELERMRNELAPDTLVRKIKSYMTGSFARSLESPSTVASFAYNTARLGLDANFYQDYLKSISAVTAEDIRAAAQKYLQPGACYVLVVGNAAAVGKKLERFSANGKIVQLDIYGDPAKTGGAVPAGLTVKKVVDNYIAATGGAEMYKKLKNYKTSYDGEIQGRTLTVVTSRMVPNFMMNTQKMGSMTLGSMKYNGKAAVQSGMGGTQKIEGKELEAVALQANFDFDWNFEAYGVKAELKGTQEVNSMNCIVMELSKGDYKETRYFDLKSGLLIRSEEMVTPPQGEASVKTTDYADYKAISGSILVPGKITQNFGPMVIELKLMNSSANEKMKASDFE